MSITTVDQDREFPAPNKIGKMEIFRRELYRMQPELQMVLLTQEKVDRFIRVTGTSLQSNRALLDCDRSSLFAAIMKCAQDGLLPDGRLAAFVPFKGLVQYIPMFAGILQKIRNSGELLSISAHVAYENDKFQYCLGDDEKIEHVPTLGERGKPVFGYAIAHTKDGGIYREVMTVDEIERIRQSSRAATSGPWVNHWGEMARKTVVRRLSKYLPMSTDIDDIALMKHDDEFNDSGAPARLTTSTDKLNELVAKQLEKPPEQPEPAKAETAAAPETATRETGAGAADQFPGDRPPGELFKAEDDTRKIAAAMQAGWMQAGWDARENGVACEVPVELRGKGHKNEAEAWKSGWNHCDDKIREEAQI